MRDYTGVTEGWRAGVNRREYTCLFSAQGVDRPQDQGAGLLAVLGRLGAQVEGPDVLLNLARVGEAQLR